MPHPVTEEKPTCTDEVTDFIHQQPRKHSQVYPTIEHWQLRDLVLCPDTRGELYLGHRNSVLKYNTSTKKIQNVIQGLTFNPASINIGRGYLAAGGQRGELVVQNLTTHQNRQISTGTKINNALHISHHAGEDRILVCNNDSTIKALSLPSLQEAGSLSLPVAVNHCSVSPDGRMLVTVGDSNMVYLYDIRASHYSRVATMKGSEDAGFSTAWNAQSQQFAVASQDGIVNVWDVRSTSKLAVLGSSQYGQRNPGACRNVKFSSALGTDLLVFSEHLNNVTLVDARHYNDRQTIHAIPPGQNGHIGGTCFSPCGTRLYIGTEKAILEYGVDVLARRRQSFGALL
ncbi:WD40-repeat-containing domain protein [Piptocephalis cylindrospora]|uniref:WD40-repeat-containing domain protein n=1 Tax=Piptocephalis cylindrospora TaxID=1907219 RepID=A0A4P9Y0S8_9FUNG|nr:WD40-repeat-containing domain protein [Piptocephalis cylindrospora]|eukprot:RKP12406.1 WD40-repeat-containing domain protein [Piptocephalis cylindrospora]